MKEAILKTWIRGKPKVQGKFCYVNDKPTFIANMTDRKWYRNFGGYAIAKQILEGFKKAKVKPVIIFKRVDLNTHYITNRTRFEKKGILVTDGDHSQWVLPLRNWKAVKGMPQEPRGLYALTIDEWIKRSKNEEGTKEEAINSRRKLGDMYREILKKGGLKSGRAIQS